MFLAKTTSYAIRTLMYMAANPEEIVSATSLYEKLGIKFQYLRRLLTDLSKSGFIKSGRGRKGGFLLARAPESIYLSEIVDAVEGLESYEGCVLGVANCNKEPVCEMHRVWSDVKNKMLHTLRSTSLATIKDKGVSILTD